MENEVIYKKAKFYNSNKRSVHISTKEFMFYNGVIIKVEKDFLVLKDEKLGEMVLIFSEINNIEPREERE